ncbi:c-type cytochrome domain-containing protein [Runella sp.]|uniref:c-type cytochrome domain-containing protein n=1 Tax=Runella sp. TaxID=1960881 RepID=UPI00260F56D0|nr:c-type cytochrome domain-containing protein [Runella sp.]
MSPSEALVQFAGRLHPLIIHLPIGILAIAVVLEFFIHKPANQNLMPAQKILLFWGAVSAVAGCAAGFLLKQEGGYNDEAVSYHQWSGIALAVAACTAYLLKRFPVKATVSKALSVCIGLLLVLAGHFGGNLTHGSDYLTQPILAMAGRGAASSPLPKKVPVTDSTKALVYADLIEPVLEQKCRQCHNAEKQKGNLRLDNIDFLKKGGKNGPVITAGNPAESALYTRLLLPEEDEKHMPPKGKPQLNENETALIHWWLEQGASFDKTVAQVPKSDLIRKIVSKLTVGGPAGNEGEPKGSSLVPVSEVDKANDRDIDALLQLGAYLKPIAADNNYLSANFINLPSFNDRQTKLLLPLSKQLVWLRLSDTEITDGGLADIAKLEQLTRLELDHTSVTDRGMEYIARLKNLQTLNLYDTQVSDAGLQKLSALKNLKAIYLYHTNVTPTGIEKIKSGWPSTELVTQ